MGHGRVGEQRRSVRPVHFASSQRGFTCAHATCTAASDFSDFCFTVPSCRQQACFLRVRAAPRLFCATVWSGGPSHTCFSDVVDCICAYLFRSACFSTRVRVMYSGGRRSEPRAAHARGGDRVLGRWRVSTLECVQLKPAEYLSMRPARLELGPAWRT